MRLMILLFIGVVSALLAGLALAQYKPIGTGRNGDFGVTGAAPQRIGGAVYGDGKHVWPATGQNGAVTRTGATPTATATATATVVPTNTPTPTATP